MQMQHFGWNKESFWGFMISLLIGAPTYLIDIAVIYFALHKLHLTIPHAVALGFILASLFNYAMNYLFVYKNAQRNHAQAIPLYFGIAFIWLWFTVVATTLLHGLIHTWHFFGIDAIYIARSIVGVFVATAGFMVTTLFTFKIPTKE